MDTRRITNGCFACFGALALGLFVPTASGGSSMGGPPGRADSVRWKDRKAETKEKQSPRTTAPAETSGRKTKFVWKVPAGNLEAEAESGSPAMPQKAEISPVASKAEPTQATGLPTTEEAVALNSINSSPQVPLTFSSPAARASAYEQVLTPRQKAILHDRALAFSLSPRDYEHLISEDERNHIEGQILERKRRLATQD